MTLKPPTPPRRPRQGRLVVTTLALALALAAGPAAATAEKAARFFEDAQQRFDKGDLGGAALQLKNAVQEDRRMLAAHLLLGRVLLRAGEFKGAEAALEEALALGTSKSEVAPLLGQVYLQLGESKKLLDTITTSGLPQSQHAEILTLRGTAMAMGGNVIAASKAFADARLLDPRSAAPLIAEAPVLLRAGERERARAAAQKATELAPENPSAWYQLGTIAHALGELQPALAAFDKALALNAKHVDARVSRAALLVNLKRDDEAAKELAQLAEWKVVEPRASFLRGMQASRAGDAAAAKAAFNEAAALIDAIAPAVRNGSEPLLMAGALSHRALGQNEKAREYLDAVLARNARHAAAAMHMAGLLLDSRDYHRAQPLVDMLRRAAPDDPQVLYLAGTLHLGRRQYEQAAEAFDRAAARGGATEAARELGVSQLALGQDKAGIANLEGALARNPADYRAGVELAVVYARQGQSAKAVKIAEGLVKVDPNNVAMINFLGNVKGRLGDLRGAGEAYRAALAKEPQFRPAVMNLSWLDMDELRFEDARKRLLDFARGRREDPDVLYQLGVLEQRARRPDEALAYWRKADQAQRVDPRPGLAMVELLTSQRRHDQALATAKSLAARLPDVLPVQLALARSYLAAGDTGLARQTLTEATKLAGFDPVQLVLVGRMQLQAGHPDGAAHAATKALQNAPGDPAAMVLAVETAARRGDAAAMDAAMAALAARHPGAPATLVTTGHIAMSRGQFAKAAQAYEAAMAREPNTPLALMLTQAHVAAREPQKALALLEAWTRRHPTDRVALRALAEVQALNGRQDAAKRSYAAIVAADPEDAGVLASFAQLLHRLGDPAAVATAEKAVRLEPNHAGYLDTLGWMLVQAGQVDAGLRHLRDARLREPGNGQIRFHLAVALAKSGRLAEARSELSAALAQGGGYAPAEEVARLRAEVGL